MNVTEPYFVIRKHFEGLHDGDLSTITLEPKMDCSGNWTEGWGHAIFHEGKILKGIENKELAYSLATVSTIEQADALLEIDTAVRVAQIKNYLGSTKIDQNTFNALACHYYNCGYSMTIFNLIRKGEYFKPQLIEFWVNHYIQSGGVIYNGLVKARCCEAHLIETGIVDFEAWQFYRKSLI